MLLAYASDGARLTQLMGDFDLTTAVWIDLYRPLGRQIARVAEFGVTIPSLAEMEEIEVSNRLYREAGADVLTVMLPGLSESRLPISGPVTFILTAERLVTVRHHAPRPFETYPTRADKVGPGCSSPVLVFLSLAEEITGRLADLLEGVGKALDGLSAQVIGAEKRATDAELQDSLTAIARETDLLGRIRVGLMTMERAISYFGTLQGMTQRKTEGRSLTPVIKGLMRDISALEVHADYLNNRLAMASDLTLGMVSLAQNATVKILSVVSALFLPPTLIASIYGMNFARMPELLWGWGYAFSLVLMLAAALGTFLVFKRKRWL